MWIEFKNGNEGYYKWESEKKIYITTDINSAKTFSAFEAGYKSVEIGSYETVEKCETRDLNSGCFLTSACCEFYGKADDCYELQTLRNFRDNVLKKTAKGRALCEQYYKIAPPIVDRLRELNNSSNYEYIYAQILDCIKYIELKEYEKAVEVYKQMCTKMQKI